MAKTPENDLLDPPFPLLTWDDYSWSGEINLPSWAGFQSRRGNYGSVNSSDSSDGSAGLMVNTQDDTRIPPTPEQKAAFQYLLDHETQVADKILQAIFLKYPEQRIAYLDAFDEYDRVLPEIQQPDELRSLIGLSNVHILVESLSGNAYVGFEFGCAWDEEHGLGVMAHLDRVVDIGGADVSFLGWIAEQDAENQS